MNLNILTKLISPLLFMSMLLSLSVHADKAQANQIVQGIDSSGFEELKKLLATYHPARLQTLLHSSHDPRSKQLEDGNYLSEITLQDGKKQEVVLLGEKYSLPSLLQGMRLFPTYENQWNLYQKLYEIGLSYPESERNGVVFPTLSEAKKKTAEQLFTLNQGVVQQLSALKRKPLPSGSPQTLVPGSRCENEEGRSAALGDGAAFYNHRAGGIYNVANFPLKDFQTCVKQQGARSSCVAFATVASVEMLFAVRYNRLLNLSEQDFYRFALWTTEPGEHFEDGLNAVNTHFAAKDHAYRFAFENESDYNPSFMRRIGFPNYILSCLGYSGTQCSDTNHQAAQFGSIFIDITPKGSTAQIDTTGVVFPPSDFGIKLAKIYLDISAPLVLVINTTYLFTHPLTDGTILHASGFPVGGSHAVAVVGYIDNASLPSGTSPGSGGGYFIIKNSWGAWGDFGYAYLPYDSFKEYGDGLLYVGIV